jgi:hypothetical protein
MSLNCLPEPSLPSSRAESPVFQGTRRPLEQKTLSLQQSGKSVKMSKKTKIEHKDGLSSRAESPVFQGTRRHSERKTLSLQQS